VLEALPDTMVRIGAGSEFGAAMNDVGAMGRGDADRSYR